MDSRRGITIGLTFIAGLYFILDFIVPPTLPLASTQGVVAEVQPAIFSAQTGANPLIQYRFSAAEPDQLKLYVNRRDILGVLKPVESMLRQLGPGSIVTIRLGPFTVKGPSTPGQGSIQTTDGQVIVPQSGQRWVDAGSGTQVVAPAPGESVTLEQPDARLVSVDRGSFTLIQGNRRNIHALTAHDVVLKLRRLGAGAEVQPRNVRVGDTVEIGPGTGFADNRDAAAKFNLVITTMAFGIGLLSLGGVHFRGVTQRKSGWYVSVFFFVALGLGVAAGVGKYQAEGSRARIFSDFMVLQIIASVSSTVFSLLAFYLASAAYRAFRVKTAEAAIMAVSAVLVMIGQTPFGTYLSRWMGDQNQGYWLPNVAAWILRVPTTAVFRAFIFGIMLGAIATALRYWLSLEKSVT